jgi:hypothetical protein
MSELVRLPVREHLRSKPRRDLLANVPPEVRGKATALPIEPGMIAAGMVWPPDDEPSDDALLAESARGFLASLDTWEGALTPAQQDKLDEIEQLLGKRREARQRGRMPR